MIKREIEKKLNKWFESSEILIIYGARQVGKTTFLNLLLKDNPDAVILNCELNNVRQILASKDLNQIRFLFGNKKIIALDEAQSVPEIGTILKIIHDELKTSYKLIVTGSSSFELSSRITEPLTGRNIKFRMLPISVNELFHFKNGLWIKDNLQSLLIYGSYPEIIMLDQSLKIQKLLELSGDYLYKDILIYENVRNSLILHRLLQCLALQIGSQVSFNELAQQLRVAPQTVEKYLDLLEKTFVIYSLGAYSTNLRNEIKKSRKYYFYDLGIRNSLINNFNLLNERTDSGALWENFCINEMLKRNELLDHPANYYFWRTYDGAEIDLVEEKNGVITPFECKWSSKRKRILPKIFKETYNNADLKIINPENFNHYFID